MLVGRWFVLLGWFEPLGMAEAKFGSFLVSSVTGGVTLILAILPYPCCISILASLPPVSAVTRCASSWVPVPIPVTKFNKNIGKQTTQ